MLSELADEELFRRFRRGERAAFEALLRRHRAPLFSFVLRMVGADDRPRAEDIVQDAFIRVLKNASGWEERAKFSTWLFTIARNLCVDSMRRERQRRAESLDGAAEEEGEKGWAHALAANRAGPERQASNIRMRPILEAALARLPEEQREVFVLREYSGVPFKEIAELTQVSENTVKSRMRYALDGLRKSLAEAGIDGDLADDDAAQSRAAVVAR